MSATSNIMTMAPLDMVGTHGSGFMAGETMGGGFFPLFPLFGLLVMLLVIGLIGYALVQAFQPAARPPADERPDSALQLLRQRYASGEIDEEEYRTRQASLKG